MNASSSKAWSPAVVTAALKGALELLIFGASPFIAGVYGLPDAGLGWWLAGLPAAVCRRSPVPAYGASPE
ncbi:hypothetical protein LJK88_38660 [Paenibacillus sp. P26]|nr:hypothetical protein LJK88_38660 [Paenibacillus sp. P26]